MVVGFNKWKEMGRARRKGPAIWIPGSIRCESEGQGTGTFSRDSDAGENDAYMVPVASIVFDVFKTEGDPVLDPPRSAHLHRRCYPPQMHTDLGNQITKRGYLIEYRESPEKVQRMDKQPEKKVVVSTCYSDAHTAMVLLTNLPHRPQSR